MHCLNNAYTSILSIHCIAFCDKLPELARQKADLVVSNASMNKQLYDIESEILYLLSNSKGNILDDTVLIETLAQSKKTSEEIKQKMVGSCLIRIVFS